MKVLALSLLRLGDFFHHLPILRAVSAEAQLTIVGWSELEPARKLFPEWTFELVSRDRLLVDMTRGSHPWLRALDQLEKTLENVLAEEWNTAVNLTHTRFATRLMDAVVAQKKAGLRFEEGRTAGWNEDWRMFNDSWISVKQPPLTYVDLLARALDLRIQAPPAPLVRQSGDIWLQVLSQDEKKNWPLMAWRKFGALLRMHGLPYRVLAAKSDAARLSDFFEEQEILTADFRELRAQKQSCRLLIGVDTSTLHFAADELLPCLGLYLGSANPYKTPPRQVGAWILRSQAACQPCSHRDPCHQMTQICAEGITAQDLWHVTKMALGQTSAGAKDDLQILKTRAEQGLLKIFPWEGNHVARTEDRRTFAETPSEA